MRPQNFSTFVIWARYR